MKLLFALARIPVLGRIMLLPYRAKIAFRSIGHSTLRVIKWLFKSKEITNFTYDIEEGNKKHLAYLVSEVAKISNDDAQKYMREILEDKELSNHITKGVIDYAT